MATNVRLPLVVSVLTLLTACSAAPSHDGADNRQEVDTAGANAPAGEDTPPLNADRSRAALIQLEQDYAQALIAKDRDFLQAYYAPDFRGGNWMGFWTKSTMLKAVLDDRYSVKSMELSNLQAKIAGTIGIVQGISTEVTTVNGRNTSGRWSFTDVFEWRDGRWLAIASHTSELKPA